MTSRVVSDRERQKRPPSRLRATDDYGRRLCYLTHAQSIHVQRMQVRAVAARTRNNVAAPDVDIIIPVRTGHANGPRTKITTGGVATSAPNQRGRGRNGSPEFSKTATPTSSLLGASKGLEPVPVVVQYQLYYMAPVMDSILQNKYRRECSGTYRRVVPKSGQFSCDRVPIPYYPSVMRSGGALDT